MPKIGLRRIALRSRPDRMRRSAASFRTIAVQMGGVLIKVGQFLSSRVDVLPPEFTKELEGLQDEVPAAAFEDIRRVIEQEFGAPLLQQFAVFDEAPLAAASLGQVHCASLIRANKGDLGEEFIAPKEFKHREVVVKVLRPNIEQIISTDLAALRTVGAWLHRYKPIRKRANVPGLLDEFTKILYEEIDYLAEGRNAETFAAHFENYPGVRVPKVLWTHTTRRVLTLENVFAIKITDYEAISKAGISRTEVASRLLKVYLKQIFEDGFFHADPHPGNLFVHPLSDTVQKPDWELTFVDFGMTGKVSANMRHGLRELLIGVGTRDSARVVKAYKLLDMLLPDVNLELLERAESRVFDQFWGKSMSELTSVSYAEMKELADEFRDLLFDMPFQVPQNIIFLARCVGILSGMCTGLDPEFNLWAHLAPYAHKIMTEELGKASDGWLEEAQKLARTVFTLPLKFDATLAKLERGELTVRAPEVSQQIRQVERATRSLTAGIIFSGFLLGGIQLWLEGYQAAAFGLFACSVISLAAAWLIRRS